MDNHLVQLLLVLFLGGIATYDTIKSRKRNVIDDRDRSKEILEYKVKSEKLFP